MSLKLTNVILTFIYEPGLGNLGIQTTPGGVCKCAWFGRK